MIRPWKEGRSSFRHGAHVSAVARMDDGKQTYILGDTGRAGLHNLSNGDSMNAPQKKWTQIRILHRRYWDTHSQMLHYVQVSPTHFHE